LPKLGGGIVKTKNNLPLIWFWKCCAPLGLWMLRPFGAMDAAPLWGYGCYAPLGLGVL